MRRPLILTMLAVAVLAGIAAWWVQHRHPADDGALRLSGTVDIRQVDLAFRVEGRLDKLLVEEGDTVRPGQDLALMETGYLDDAVRLAQARLDGARANLSKLETGNRPQEIAQARAEMDRIQAAYTNAKATFDRRAALPIDSTISRQSLDNARADLRQAEAQLSRAREALSLQEKGFRLEDIAQARAQAQAEEATLSLMVRRRGDAVLTAPAAGRIMTRVREPGSMVMPGATVLTLALSDPMQVRAWVAEPDLGHAVPGTKADITTDGGRTYHGQVGFVSPVAEFTPKSVETTQLRTSLVYRLRIIVSDPDDGLRQGMPVTVALRPQS